MESLYTKLNGVFWTTILLCAMTAFTVYQSTQSLYQSQKNAILIEAALKQSIENSEAIRLNREEFKRLAERQDK